MKTIALEGQLRSDLGKKASRQLRREEKVPCVLYGGGENIHFYAKAPAFRPAIYTPDFHKIEITLNGDVHAAIIKDIQFHPVKDTIEHVDFIRLTPGKRLITEIPVKLVGFAIGSQEGGSLVLKTRKIAVRVKPEDLVDHISVDVTPLTLGKSFKVGDLVAKNMEMLSNPGLPVVTCEIPRALKGKQEEDEAAEEAAAAAAAAEEGEEGAATPEEGAAD